MNFVVHNSRFVSDVNGNDGKKERMRMLLSASALVTVHRHANVDDVDWLSTTIRTLADIGQDMAVLSLYILAHDSGLRMTDWTA
jgi:hypothetical protein